jgi:hypothetical protein
MDERFDAQTNCILTPMLCPVIFKSTVVHLPMGFCDSDGRSERKTTGQKILDKKMRGTFQGYNPPFVTEADLQPRKRER